MIINPQKAYEEGWVKYAKRRNVQQNGIDLCVSKISILTSPLILTQKSREISMQFPLDAKEDRFSLKKLTPYLVETLEYISVPKNVCALLIQRSTLNRSGIQILSSWYDSGFQNYGGATIYPFMDAEIEKGARIVQVIFFEAESASEYKGIYKNDSMQ